MKNKHNDKRSVKQTLLRRTEFSMIVIIAILFLIAAVGTKNFLTAYNLTNILKQSSIIGIIAIAETCIIITGGIDISCGAVVGMSTLVVTMAQGRWGLSIPAAICLALISGLLCGALNAVLVHEFNVTPFVATLGTQTIIRGLIKVYSNGGTVSGLKPEFSSFASSSFGILPNLSVVWIAIAIIMFLVLRYTVYGRNLFILGSGKEVTRLNGISIRKVKYISWQDFCMQFRAFFWQQESIVRFPLLEKHMKRMQLQHLFWVVRLYQAGLALFLEQCLAQC